MLKMPSDASAMVAPDKAPVRLFSIGRSSPVFDL
jgi:hypothetical protein